MNPVYLGVDVAGKDNTWVAALSGEGNRLSVVHGPRLATLVEIAQYCEENHVVAAAIDAQLSIALSDENGFRASDRCLQDWLPEDCRGWVMSFNSLMAVPVRGRLLADNLAPTVGTIVETHPRASLLFRLGYVKQEIRMAICQYKRKGSDTKEQTKDRAKHTRTLWELWSERFGLAYGDSVEHDGALDSLVCATVAHLFHKKPNELYRLRHNAADKTGRGPFYVLDPSSYAPNAE